MTSTRMSSAITLTLTFTFLTLSLAKKGKIAVYWGQEGGDSGSEDTLSSTCEFGNYDIVLVSFLDTFGCGRTPSLNLHTHCGIHTCTPCTTLHTQIQHCQKNGVKVFLALGGPRGSYSLCSTGDAKVVSNYLYGNFLSGESGPLGSVVLDGIHLHIENGGSYLHWEDLLHELYKIKERGFTFYLSSAPLCFLPDRYLDRAIKTGYFDYIFIRFYNCPTCQYSSSSNASFLLDSWNAWSFYVSPNTSLLMGLPGAPDAALNGGYIPTQNFINDVLPYIQQTPSYGGVALWDRSRDVQTRFSNLIKPLVLDSTETMWSVISNSSCICM
ncbi:hypothetical protein VNO78_21539 [Psophocarpus tetragonolobus]|uniref:GH18 domain-containing protein n=1 Tax=Psophocarpus tetragonolobus TaxID=3891 RepID=A0AAN9SGR6_PSOTE